MRHFREPSVAAKAADPADAHPSQTRRAWLPGLLAIAIGWLGVAAGGAPESTRIWAYLPLAVAAYLVLRPGPDPFSSTLGPALRRGVWVPALATAVTILWSVHPSLSYEAALLWTAFCLTAWLACVAGRHGIGRLAAWLTTALALPPLAGLSMLVLWDYYPRAMTFSYANAAGITMAVLILLCLARQIHLLQVGVAPRRVSAWWPTVVGLFASLFLWHSLSRASLYLTAVGLLLVVFLLPRAWRWQGLVLGAVMVAAGNWLRHLVPALVKGLTGAPSGSGLAGAHLPSPVAAAADMAITASDLSVSARLEFWQIAWRAFLDRPWGWGAGTFGDVFFDFAPSGTVVFARSAHSLLFGSLMEAGPLLVGGLALLGGAWLLTVASRWRSVPPPERPLMAGAVAAVITLSGHALVDFTWEIPAVLLTAAALGGMVIGRVNELGGTVVSPHRREERPRSPLFPLLFALALALLVIRPPYAHTLVTKGQKLLEAGQTVQAVASFERAALVDPLNPLAPSWLAETYFRQWQAGDSPADLARAEAAVRQAIRRAPRLAELHRQAAWMRLAAGDTEGFREQMLQGLRYKPFHIGLIVELSQVDVREGRVSEARERMERVLAAYPRLERLHSAAALKAWRPQLRMTLALAYLAEGKRLSAIDQLEQLLQEHPDSAAARAILAQLRP